jgi:hypothetical protein
MSHQSYTWAVSPLLFLAEFFAVLLSAFLEKRRNFGRQGNYLLSYKYLWALSENERILLAKSKTSTIQGDMRL